PEPQPPLRDAEEVLAGGRMLDPDLRQRRHIPPRGVARRVDPGRPTRPIGVDRTATGEDVRVQVEPVPIRRLEPVLEEVLEREEAPPHTVEHPAAAPPGAE